MLLSDIIRNADSDRKFLSKSARAKDRLFGHFDTLFSQSEEAGIGTLAKDFVEALNLSHERVKSLDEWLKNEACLTNFKDADSVRRWMYDFGEHSNSICSVADCNLNNIVGDFFQNLPKSSKCVLCDGECHMVISKYVQNGILHYVQNGAILLAKTTLQDIQPNLRKVTLAMCALVVSASK